MTLLTLCQMKKEKEIFKMHGLEMWWIATFPSKFGTNWLGGLAQNE